MNYQLEFIMSKATKFYLKYMFAIWLQTFLGPLAIATITLTVIVGFIHMLFFTPVDFFKGSPWESDPTEKQ